MPGLAPAAEDLTPDWLTAALRSGGLHGTVTGVASERIGSGQLGATYLLTLTYDTDDETGAPRSLVAKLPASDRSSREYAAALGCYPREVAFYTKLAASTTTRTPHCYYADVSGDGTSFVLLLEDLTPTDEYGQSVGCGPDQAAVALGQAAALHASTWHHDELLTADWLVSGHAAWHQVGSTAAAGQQMFRDRYRELLDDGSVRVATALAGGLAEKWVARTLEPRCVWHSDFRLDNLLLGAAGGTVPCAVVDWQSVMAANGTVDASYFLGSSLDVGIRREHEEQLMRGYHAALLDGGVTEYSWDECWREYRINALAGFLVAVSASLGTERSSHADTMFTTMAARHAAHIEDHATLNLLED